MTTDKWFEVWLCLPEADDRASILRRPDVLGDSPGFEFWM